MTNYEIATLVLGVLGFLSVLFKLGRMSQKFDDMVLRVEDMRKDVIHLGMRISHLEGVISGSSWKRGQEL